MKNKKTVYILLFSVALVWGIVFYRTFMAFSQENELPVQVPEQKVEVLNLSDHTADSYQLAFNYPDPFKVQAKQKEVAPHETASIPAKENKTAFSQPVPWPTIKYTGYFNNVKSKKKITILNIAGRDLMLNEGETQQGIKLLKNIGDSIKVSFNQSIKFIHLN